MSIENIQDQFSDPVSATNIVIGLTTTWSGLLDLERPWKRLYALDSQRDYFLSYDWIKECFLESPNSWRVMTATLNGDVIGIFPLSERVRFSTSESREISIWQTGGKLHSAQYAGFLCDERQLHSVASAFGACLRKQKFDRLRLENFLQTDRLELLHSGFNDKDYRIRRIERPSNDGKTDNLICPKIALSGSFEKWIETFSANRRRKFRRALRTIGPDGDYRVLNSTPKTALAHLEILLSMWAKQWKGVRSDSSVALWQKRYWQILKNPARRGDLYVPILCKGNTPVCAVGNIHDRAAGHSYCIVTGRNIEIEDQDIGIMIHMHCLEKAFADGFMVYDFCHGNEPYKYSFGSEDRRLSSVEIRRR